MRTGIRFCHAIMVSCLVLASMQQVQVYAHSTSGGSSGGQINVPSSTIQFYADGDIEHFVVVSLYGVPDGFTISNDKYPGWCVDYYDSNSPTGNFYDTVPYSTTAMLPSHLQHENWDMVNYVLNHKQGNKDDVQNAIWFLIDGTAWEITPTTKAMLLEAEANGEGFIPGAGQLAAVILDQNFAQRLIIEVPVPPQTPPTEPPQCDDFVTGGGWIIGPSGKKANFGIHGGIKKGKFWGGLNYLDHGTGMHVKSTAVTGYRVIDARTRMIDYAVTVDGAAGTANVMVTDNGEPGRNDVFSIKLSTGYQAGGDLGGARPGGGNIQLHNKCNKKSSTKPMKQN